MKVDSYNLTNMDAAENIYFARELEYVKAKSYDVVYPTLKAEQFIPVSTEVPAGAESWTYTQYDILGMAKLMASYADDLPRSDVKGTQFNQKVHAIGNSFGYNVQEVRTGQLTGKPLDQKRAAATRETHARKIDSLAFAGDTKSNLVGFSNNSHVSEITAGSKTGGGTTWISATATGTEMLADLYAMVNKVDTITLGCEEIDTILMPLEQFQKGAQTKMGTVNDTTVFEMFKKSHPNVTLASWSKLDNAASDGSDLMIGYRKSPDKVCMEKPLEFTVHAPQPKGLEFLIPCESRFGGVVFYYPLSAVYMKGA